MPAIPLFTGCATALITPFRPDGSIDMNALRRLIRIQLNAGIDALVLLGTTGEPGSLSMSEREMVISAGLEEVNSRIPVIVGTGSNYTQRTIEYARQAKELGAQGQLCVTPYYSKCSQTGLIRHYEAILDHAALPMILYNVPGRTGMEIAPETASLLSEHPDIVGLKEASGRIHYAQQLIEILENRLPVYGGNDDQILPLIAIGAVGAISVCSNAFPIQTKSLVNACLDSRPDQARIMQSELAPLIRLLACQVNPIPIKAVLSMQGLISEILRLPLTPLEEPHRAKLQTLISSSLQ